MKDPLEGEPLLDDGNAHRCDHTFRRLLAASARAGRLNPVGQRDFEPRSSSEGRYTIPAGGSLTLRYRVLLHAGDEQEAKLAERYADYAAGK